MSITYYHEYRSKDQNHVKLYHQKMGVSYADYKVGKWYIDPSSLKTDEYDDLILPLYPETINMPLTQPQQTLLDVI
jgi:hypothetical protein